MTDQQLLDLAKECGTPLFVYDGDLMLRRYRELYDFIPLPDGQLEIHYAMKANYNPALLKLLKADGCGIDAVSPGEVLLAQRLGFSTEKIIYTANNMTDAELEKVFATGVLINLDSISRLKKFGKKHPGSPVCLRFNPDVVDGDSAMTMTAGALTKFGILLEDVPEVKQVVKEYGLHVVGLHAHTGSGLQKAESVCRSMRQIMGIATQKNFPELEFLDFGGGFKVPYRPDEERIDYVTLGRDVAELFTGFCKTYGRNLRLLFEPGKYIAAECGTLLVEINTLKNNRSRLIAGCNAGFPQLIRPVLYNAYHHIRNLSNPDGKPAKYDIVGNICETGDRFAEERLLPEIREYDILAIENAGAYCYSMGGIYNFRAMPGEVVLKDGQRISFRPRLSDNELIDMVLKNE